jgi:hypothetical protein
VPNDMFFWWDSFLNDFEGDCSKSSLTSSGMSLLRTVGLQLCFQLHTLPVTWISLLGEPLFCSALSHLGCFFPKIMTHLVRSKHHTQPSYDIQTEDRCSLALSSRSTISTNIGIKLLDIYPVTNSVSHMEFVGTVKFRVASKKEHSLCVE